MTSLVPQPNCCWKLKSDGDHVEAVTRNNVTRKDCLSKDDCLVPFRLENEFHNQMGKIYKLLQPYHIGAEMKTLFILLKEMSEHLGCVGIPVYCVGIPFFYVGIPVSWLGIPVYKTFLRKPSILSSDNMPLHLQMLGKIFYILGSFK